MKIESGHTDLDMALCPTCNERDGWQDAKGLRYAAQNIRHEATTDEELDLAEVCEFIAATHYQVDGKCLCGDEWFHTEANVSAGCQTVIDVVTQKNFWLMRKVWRLRAKYAGVTLNVHAR